MKIYPYIISFVLGIASFGAYSSLIGPNLDDQSSTLVIEASQAAPVTYMFMLRGQPPIQGTTTEHKKFSIPGAEIGTLTAQTIEKQSFTIAHKIIKNGKSQDGSSVFARHISVSIYPNSNNWVAY
ncbi:hypothetical protein EIP75_23885 [Aquabacterium soli]|uniref:Uncharacterized protein n=1 Tax=Aquabacterium soli TaxID=2493092 RepID=A0A426UWQ3_9BURK|nr:hypothetical protein [Aquabacterium soli]RRR98861.1 hypothetical protein EIP75_23885 [Aquabacterium soli]